MQGVFLPAFGVLKRYRSPVNFGIAGTLCVAPQLVTVTLLVTHGHIVAASVVVVLTAVALYFLAALCLWTTADASVVREMVERVASGDLTARMLHPRGDQPETSEAEQLRLSVAQMSSNLTDIVHQVAESADAIAGLTTDMATGSADLSRRTSEQAASLETTAASMQQISATVRQTADTCRQASAVAAKASLVAGRAAERTSDVVETMQQITAGSRQVAEIVGTIEGIAARTNILALNAAVEAARAGEHGTGFAVIATEVRNLAQRTATAAQEITTLVDGAVERIGRGASLVDEAGATMNEVVANVHQVTDLIAAIASASSQQSGGIEDVNRAMLQMDGVTRENAALAEQTAAAALSFEHESVRLLDVLGSFKTDRGEDRAQAVQLVKRAVAHVREIGLERACAQFNDPHGPFCEGNYYIWSGDFDGVILANGSQPDARGQQTFGLKAADGRLFIQEIIQTARTKGKGWCDYPWKNPATKRTEQKSTYFEAIDGAFIACGIYRGRKAPAARPGGASERTAATSPVGAQRAS